MKKIALFAAALALVGGMVIGCSGGDAAPADAKKETPAAEEGK